MVLTHHCVLAGLIPISPGWGLVLSRYTPLHLFVNGRAPVILFFVLSGFVLSLSLEGARSFYAQFAARRLCRIYLPFAAVILISAILCWVSPSIPALAGSWAGRTWSEDASGGLVLRHLLMPVMGVDLTLDRPGWSLVHEIRISLLFPLLWLAVRRAPRAALAGSFAVSLAGWRWSGCSDLGCLPFNGVDTGSSFGATAYFVPFFVLGILLARQREAVLASLGRRSVPGRAVLWTLAVYGMIVPFKFNLLPDVAVGLSAALLLALTLASPAAQRVLGAWPLLWLGRVSFSLYLVHVIVLAAVIRWGFGEPPVALLIGTVVGSLAAADVLYRTVERPCIRLGSRLAGWLASFSPPKARTVGGAAFPASIQGGRLRTRQTRASCPS